MGISKEAEEEYYKDQVRKRQEEWDDHVAYCPACEGRTSQCRRGDILIVALENWEGYLRKVKLKNKLY